MSTQQLSRCHDAVLRFVLHVHAVSLLGHMPPQEQVSKIH
uniref:Uncharacterized protein n=1 Tax=Arundo donax TaxID=35708 RepID=A0A0A8ZTH2_ARUDO